MSKEKNPLNYRNEIVDLNSTELRKDLVLVKKIENPVKSLAVLNTPKDELLVTNYTPQQLAAAMSSNDYYKVVKTGADCKHLEGKVVAELSGANTVRGGFEYTVRGVTETYILLLAEACLIYTDESNIKFDRVW